MKPRSDTPRQKQAAFLLERLALVQVFTQEDINLLSEVSEFLKGTQSESARSLKDATLAELEEANSISSPSAAAATTDVTRAAEILEEYAEQLRDGCTGHGEAESFTCDDCPAGRSVCKSEHAEIVRCAAAVRAIGSPSATSAIITSKVPMRSLKNEERHILNSPRYGSTMTPAEELLKEIVQMTDSAGILRKISEYFEQQKTLTEVAPADSCLPNK